MKVLQIICLNESILDFKMKSGNTNDYDLQITNIFKMINV